MTTKKNDDDDDDDKEAQSSKTPSVPECNDKQNIKVKRKVNYMWVEH